MILLIILLSLALMLIIRLYMENLLVLIPIIPITLLIPGRIQGYYYRNFFKARRLLGERNFQASIECNENFLADIRLYTWRKKLIWLSWGMYSKDIEAMTLNNLGTSYLHSGNFDTAEGYFNESIRLDTSYPIPYYNLSVLANIKGNKENAEKLYKKSAELGFRQTTFDNVIQIGQQILANIEGI